MALVRNVPVNCSERQIELKVCGDRLSEFDPVWTNNLINDLSDEAEKFARAGTPDAVLNREIKAYMRYAGQGWEIVVNLPNREFNAEDKIEIRRLFETEYIRLFGRALEGLDIEIMNWSVQASTPLAEVEKVKPVGEVKIKAAESKRKIFDAREQKFVEAAVFDRAALEAGSKVYGPAIIVEQETTTIVTAAFEAILQSDQCLLVQRQSSGASHA